MRLDCNGMACGEIVLVIEGDLQLECIPTMHGCMRGQIQPTILAIGFSAMGSYT